METVFAGHWEKGNNSFSCLHDQGIQPGGARSRGFGGRRGWWQISLLGRAEESKLSPRAAEGCKEKRAGEMVKRGICLAEGETGVVTKVTACGATGPGHHEGHIRRISI